MRRSPRWLWWCFPAALFLGSLPWVYTLVKAQSPHPAQVPQTANPNLAQAADRFVDTIGVTIHLYYRDTAYNEFEKIVKPRLVELGIRHVRDGAYTEGHFYKTYYQRCKALAEQGVRFNLVINNKVSGNRWVSATDFSELSTIYRNCGNGIASFEGSNEPDLFGPRNGARDWLGSTREAQRFLYQGVKGNATLKSLPVIAPSVISVEAANALGKLEKFVDYGNIHNYYAGRHPETRGWGGPFQLKSVRLGQLGCRKISPQDYNAQNQSMSIYGTVLFNLNCLAKPISGDKPVIATETGWDNAVNQNPGKPSGSIPESVSAVYVPRLFLHHWNQGIARTYIYEFLDLKPNPAKTNPEHNFGLVRNNGTPKPAYNALKNLIQTLQDPGSGFQPKSLAYQLQGQTNEVQQALFQKRDGDFYLALWLGVPIWDPNQRKPITVQPQAVTLKLSQPIQTAARLDWQTDGSMTINKQPIHKTGDRTSEIKLQVSPQMTLLRLSPR